MSTNNVKRFSAPDANNRITEWVTTYANHYDEILTALTLAQLESDALNERLANYDALAASHAELVGLIAALLPALRAHYMRLIADAGRQRGEMLLRKHASPSQAPRLSYDHPARPVRRRGVG